MKKSLMSPLEAMLDGPAGRRTGLGVLALFAAVVSPGACSSEFDRTGPEVSNLEIPGSETPGDGDDIGTLDPSDETFVPIDPGQDIQSIVDGHPPGTAFLIRAGVHSRQRIEPRTGDVFRGEPGAVLDGGDELPFAFYGRRDIDDVRIERLEIRGYDSPDQWGAVRGVDTRGWVVRNNHIHSNKGGVRLGHEMRILNNHIHHNRQTGIMGQGDFALIQGNEIDHQNTDLEYMPGTPSSECGGIKITFSRQVTIRNNHVHHNGVTGIWLDIDNVDAVVEANLVTDNLHQGIYHEISYGGIIRNNTVSGNGFAPTAGWYHNAGIVVISSPDVEVYGNTVTGNAKGIMGTQQNRGAGSDGPYLLQNLWVHHNTISMGQGVSGVARDDSVDDAVFLHQNNRFDHNVYHFGPEERYFRWMNANLTASEWVAYGHDGQGEFHAYENSEPPDRQRLSGISSP
jgi:parallel beta-helix repeat protein